jgi:hypothetical protein
VWVEALRGETLDLSDTIPFEGPGDEVTAAARDRANDEPCPWPSTS